MRFKTELRNIRTFSRLTAALNSLEKIAWVRLHDETAQFTVIPDTGSQVWATLPMNVLFESYNIESAEAGNTINLELPLGPLQRALKSADGSTEANLRLTKRDGVPVLCMTIHTTIQQSTNQYSGGSTTGGFPSRAASADPFAPAAAAGPTHDYDADYPPEALDLSTRREREKVITQDIPVRVLHPETVQQILQPKVREPEVHILLPPLLQLKAISDRFARLGASSHHHTGGGGGGMSNGGGGGGSRGAGGLQAHPKLELAANMHGGLRLRVATEAVTLESTWEGLENPGLDEKTLEMDIRDHPSSRFRAAGPDKWATVRVDARDWSRVLSVGRLDSSRVIACFTDEHALILYVYVPSYDDATAEESVVTYYISSFST